MPNNKIIAKTQWDEKFLREALWMPFGSLCNLIGQAYQGKGIALEELEALARKAFELAMDFSEEAFNRVEKIEEEPDIKVKEE
jgi:hypothetical protein